MKRYHIYIGSWEISWYHTTWKDWLPMIITGALLFIGTLSLVVYIIITG